ncbi:MAG: hypothetical protein M5U09_21630 [Gammaproteobacteria bacterium]|nr:hypothetical protein [Gammaproteobacteria bacterium]
MMTARCVGRDRPASQGVVQGGRQCRHGGDALRREPEQKRRKRPCCQACDGADKAKYQRHVQAGNRHQVPGASSLEYPPRLGRDVVPNAEGDGTDDPDAGLGIEHATEKVVEPVAVGGRERMHLGCGEAPVVLAFDQRTGRHHPALEGPALVVEQSGIGEPVNSLQAEPEPPCLAGAHLKITTITIDTDQTVRYIRRRGVRAGGEDRGGVDGEVEPREVAVSSRERCHFADDHGLCASAVGVQAPVEPPAGHQRDPDQACADPGRDERHARPAADGRDGEHRDEHTDGAERTRGQRREQADDDGRHERQYENVQCEASLLPVYRLRFRSIGFRSCRGNT